MESPPNSYIGKLFRQRRAGDVEFGWWWTRKFGAAIDEHEHERAHIMYVCAGDFATRAEGGARATEPIVFYPSGTVHQDRFLSPGLFFSLTFHSSPDALGVPAPSAPVAAQAIRAKAIVNRLINELDGPTNEQDATAECLVAELMAAFLPEPAPDREPRWLNAVDSQIRSEEAAPRLAELARTAGVHPYHLAATFRRAHGCTPAQYARNLRLERSLRSLINSHAPIAEIAMQYGFADQSHFTRAIRTMFGIGPAELRRRLR